MYWSEARLRNAITGRPYKLTGSSFTRSNFFLSGELDDERLAIS